MQTSPLHYALSGAAVLASILLMIMIHLFMIKGWYTPHVQVPEDLTVTSFTVVATSAMSEIFYAAVIWSVWLMLQALATATRPIESKWWTVFDLVSSAFVLAALVYAQVQATSGDIVVPRGISPELYWSWWNTVWWLGLIMTLIDNLPINYVMVRLLFYASDLVRSE